MTILSSSESQSAHRCDVPHSLLQPHAGSGSISRTEVASVPTSAELESSAKIEMFVSALREAGYRTINSVRPRLADGILYLEGTVDSYYQKQVAQEAVRPFAIGLQICNELKVK